MKFFNQYGILILILLVVAGAGWYVHNEMNKEKTPAVPGNTGIAGGLNLPGSSTNPMMPEYTEGNNGYF
jgi:hypothetical protein